MAASEVDNEDDRFGVAIVSATLKIPFDKISSHRTEHVQSTQEPDTWLYRRAAKRRAASFCQWSRPHLALLWKYLCLLFSTNPRSFTYNNGTRFVGNALAVATLARYNRGAFQIRR